MSGIDYAPGTWTIARLQSSLPVLYSTGMDDDAAPQMFRYTIGDSTGELPTGYSKKDWREIFVDSEEASAAERRDIMLRRLAKLIQVEEI